MSQRSGPVAVISGATSGIGLATAIAFQARGFNVYGTSRKPSGQVRDGITMIPCDITRDDSVASLVKEVMERSGRLDVLINNAGFGLIGGAEESSVEQAKEIFEVNVFGLMRVTNHVLPHMRQQRRGRIINMGSVLGFIPAPFNAIYGATKHAIEGFSQSLDHEVRNFGVRVIAIEPAITRTAFDKNLVSPDRPLSAYEAARRAMTAFSAKAIERGDEPEIVANVVVRAATERNPKMRYPAGPAARQLSVLRRMLPERLFNAILRKQFQLS